ncbi:MAG TPA: helix-turn-helix transcriptional regulator [Caldilineaceae bacterium]|nr:helix-turn-helix transcriptional regulator [Caldilineaceae bacterium]
MTQQTEPQSALPLTEAAFFILLSLAPQPKHGYAIMKEVEQLSSGRVTLSTGTLYGAIKRLLEQGWIEPVDEEDLPESNPDEPKRGRKAYQLTDWGRRILAAEAARLESLVIVAQHQLVGKGAL